MVHPQDLHLKSRVCPRPLRLSFPFFFFFLLTPLAAVVDVALVVLVGAMAIIVAVVEVRAEEVGGMMQGTVPFLRLQMSHLAV